MIRDCAYLFPLSLFVLALTITGLTMWYVGSQPAHEWVDQKLGIHEDEHGKEQVEDMGIWKGDR